MGLRTPVIANESCKSLNILTANATASTDNRTSMLSETFTVPQTLQAIERFLLLEVSLAHHNVGNLPRALLQHELVMLSGVDEETVERQA